MYFAIYWLYSTIYSMDHNEEQTGHYRTLTIDTTIICCPKIRGYIIIKLACNRMIFYTLANCSFKISFQKFQNQRLFVLQMRSLSWCSTAQSLPQRVDRNPVMCSLRWEEKITIRLNIRPQSIEALIPIMVIIGSQYLRPGEMSRS